MYIMMINSSIKLFLKRKWSPYLRYFTDNIQMSPGPSFVAEKSKGKVIISGSMLLYSIPKSQLHTKNNERLKWILTIRLYSILRLCNPQFTIIVLRFLFKVTLNHSWFQNVYFECLSQNFTIAW